MVENEETKRLGLVPEIFFDLIARVIPGTVFLLVYWLVYLPYDLSILKEVPWILYVAALFVAYFVGFSAHVLSRMFLPQLLKKIRLKSLLKFWWIRKGKTEQGKTEQDKTEQDETEQDETEQKENDKGYISTPEYKRTRDILVQIENLPQSQQNLIKKMMAESKLFQTCVVLSIFFIVPWSLPPNCQGIDKPNTASTAKDLSEQSTTGQCEKITDVMRQIMATMKDIYPEFTRPPRQPLGWNCYLACWASLATLFFLFCHIECQAQLVMRLEVLKAKRPPPNYWWDLS